MSEEVVLEVKNLKKYFPAGKGHELHAVDDVSFQIHAGETLGLVGESGCGKTTCARTLIGMYQPTAGQVLVFQDPYASLDPRMTVSDIIAEGLDIHHMVSSKAERTKRIYELLEMVDLNAEHANRFIHEFSGGQRQRIGIARALAVNPKLLILDEPISALDVSIQAQVVNMLQRLQKELHLSYLFVAHDLSMVRHISDRVAVMYLGRIVELASSEELYSDPRHPYTQALMSAVPVPDPEAEAERRKKRIRLEGEVPSPIDPPEHCRFAGRCPFATDRCRKEEPQLKEHEPGHWTACFLEEAKEHR